VFLAAGVGFNAPVATLEAVDRDAAIRKHYYAAKYAAEQALMASTLPWTMQPQQVRHA
jgi:uncharacterized protein YbjT (DUF2867 family)